MQLYVKVSDSTESLSEIGYTNRVPHYLLRYLNGLPTTDACNVSVTLTFSRFDASVLSCIKNEYDGNA